MIDEKTFRLCMGSLITNLLNNISMFKLSAIFRPKLIGSGFKVQRFQLMDIAHHIDQDPKYLIYHAGQNGFINPMKTESIGGFFSTLNVEP